MGEIGEGWLEAPTSSYEMSKSQERDVERREYTQWRNNFGDRWKLDLLVWVIL